MTEIAKGKMTIIPSLEIYLKSCPSEAKQNTINNIVEPCLVLKAQKHEIINRKPHWYR
jgi:hypothetical protein